MPSPTNPAVTLKRKPLLTPAEKLKEHEKNVFSVIDVMSDVLDNEPATERFNTLIALACFAESGMTIMHRDPAGKIGLEFGYKLSDLLHDIPGTTPEEECTENYVKIYDVINPKLVGRDVRHVYEAAMIELLARVHTMTCEQHFAEFESRIKKIEDDALSALLDSKTNSGTN
jgi:hypothetical protein